MSTNETDERDDQTTPLRMRSDVAPMMTLAELERENASLRAEVKRLRGPDDTGDDSLCNVRRLRAEVRAQTEIAEDKGRQCHDLLDQNAALRDELAANAKLLARQTDLARQAEIERDAAICKWQTGTPDVPKGGMRRYWCAISREGKIYHRILGYAHDHVMPLSNDCSGVPEECCRPVSEDSDEYYWNGWFQESCDYCDTQWVWDEPVIAWMELPKYTMEEAKP